MKRRLNKIIFALFSLAMLAFTSSHATAEVITCDYYNDCQVKSVHYDDYAAIDCAHDISGNRA